MRQFQQKRGLSNILHSRPVLGLLGILVLFFAWGVVGFFGKMRGTTENREILENKVAELEQQKESLTLGIEKLETQEGKEESIREKFGLVKEGEGVIVLVDEKNSQPTSENESGFWGFLKNLFK